MSSPSAEEVNAFLAPLKEAGIPVSVCGGERNGCSRKRPTLLWCQCFC